VKVCFNSRDVKIKHVRTLSDGEITGLVEGFSGSWKAGYSYQLRNADGDEFLAELLRTEDHGEKTRLVFEK